MPKGIYKRKSAEVRFWEKVNIQNVDACWEWTSSLFRAGYGKFHFEGKTTLASRISWRFNNGTIPEGMCVLHSCDNRKCVNPKHLFLGTPADNMEDKCRKGRHRSPIGEDHGGAKLTRAQVLEIRNHNGTEPQHVLAKKYGVSRTVISRIKTGTLWGRV